MPSYAGSERAADQRTRAADSAQISQRRAPGMRCAAGQLTEHRAHCAADSAHIWSTRSASTVDHSARTRPVRRASRSQIPTVHAKTGPSRGRRSADRTVATTGHPVRHSRPPRPPQGTSMRWWRRQARIDRVAAEVAQNWVRDAPARSRVRCPLGCAKPGHARAHRGGIRPRLHPGLTITSSAACNASGSASGCGSGCGTGSGSGSGSGGGSGTGGGTGGGSTDSGRAGFGFMGSRERSARTPW